VRRSAMVQTLRAIADRPELSAKLCRCVHEIP
jgi:hypothetical protein